jgi:hypothetical protein
LKNIQPIEKERVRVINLTDGLKNAIVESVVAQIQVFQVPEMKKACHNQEIILT